MRHISNLFVLLLVFGFFADVGSAQMVPPSGDQQVRQTDQSESQADTQPSLAPATRRTAHPPAISVGEARTKYASAMRKAQEEFDLATEQAQKQYVADLDVATKQAMASQNIEAARQGDDLRRAAIEAMNEHRPTLVISKAIWGDEARNVDVADKLKDGAAKGEIILNGKQSFGDPAPSRRKTLAVTGTLYGYPFLLSITEASGPGLPPIVLSLSPNQNHD